MLSQCCSLHYVKVIVPAINREDIASGKLGSPPLMQMLRMLKPKRWFAAHLHVRFDALVEHADTAPAEKTTDTEKYAIYDITYMSFGSSINSTATDCS